jgi:hypothetical protein
MYYAPQATYAPQAACAPQMCAPPMRGVPMYAPQTRVPQMGYAATMMC